MALAELDRLLEERDKLVAQVQALTATIAHQGESYRTILREAAAQMEFDSRMLNRRTPSRGEEVAQFHETVYLAPAPPSPVIAEEFRPLPVRP
jgi:hypothetical protein